MKGVSFFTGQSNIKYKNRDDFLLMKFDEIANVAGVFTQSKTRAASVNWCIEALKKTKGKVSVFAVNAGNANSYTGKLGDKYNDMIIKELAVRYNCDKELVLNSSTGVIGENLPMEQMFDVIDKAFFSIPVSLEQAAAAILTTDTKVKIAEKKVNINGYEITIAGFAKGSGMIEPNMATMLAYIFIDLELDSSVLQNILNEYTKTSFNSISVDGDCSTNDSLLLFSTKKYKLASISTLDMSKIIENINVIMLELAKKIILDGEGATKFIEVEVKNTPSYSIAYKLGKLVINSNLVKTALFAGDANWGRIIMALGKIDEDINFSKLNLYIGDILIVKDGEVNPDYTEDKKILSYMKNHAIKITIDLNIGDSSATVFGCDLSHDYIKINAEYRS